MFTKVKNFVIYWPHKRFCQQMFLLKCGWQTNRSLPSTYQDNTHEFKKKYLLTSGGLSGRAISSTENLTSASDWGDSSTGELAVSSPNPV